MKNFHSQPSASLPCSPLLYDCPVCSSGALGPSLLHYERCLRFVFLSWKELSACFVSSRCHLFCEAQLRWHLFSDVVQYPRWKDLPRFNPTSLCFIALSISCISSFCTHPSAAVCPSKDTWSILASIASTLLTSMQQELSSYWTKSLQLFYQSCFHSRINLKNIGLSEI